MDFFLGPVGDLFCLASFAMVTNDRLGGLRGSIEWSEWRAALPYAAPIALFVLGLFYCFNI